MRDKLSDEESLNLIKVLKERFEMNMSRHENLSWTKVQERIELSPEALWSLNEMEKTGGEPDIVEFDFKSGYIFVDCSYEIPTGRRNTCYDPEALESRKKNKPEKSAIGMCEEMGIEILDENMYRKLQSLGEFDKKTSSWIKTPESIRKLGGAVFGDRRYDTVFVYHNGAESYYAARGFRGYLEIR